ncbi:hypothetical protein G6F43_003610 [Rhizopus delemar]|nr:hypothetical protein G6F43_003610 [Rhizopus delemar]
MSNFQGFVFQDPNKKENFQEEQNSSIEAASNQVIVTEEEDNINSRLQNYLDARSYFSSRIEIQEKRRLKALELQRRQRNDIVSSLRKLDVFGSNNDEEEEEEEEEEGQKGEEHNMLKRTRGDSDVEMEEVVKLSKSEPHKRKKKPQQKNIYANQIMYAEYLESIPSDFMKEWVSVICPKGKRCLVTSGKGQTIARSRGGKILRRFQSILPNGSRYHLGSDYCILDCIYDAVHWTFYILDIMCWKGYSVTDCDTNFRNFWLHTKFQPNELDLPNSENRFYKFVPLQAISTTEVSSIAKNPEQYLNETQQNTYEIDGLLFYHKQAHYIGGSTPLVCWVPYDKIPQLLL